MKSKLSVMYTCFVYQLEILIGNVKFRDIIIYGFHSNNILGAK